MYQMMKSVTNTALKTFVTSSFAKKKFGMFLRFIATLVTRSLLTFVISALVHTDILVLDYISQIITTISMFLATDMIYAAMLEFQQDFDDIAKYIIENYSEENMRRWKRYCALTGCAMFVTICSIFTLDSRNSLIYSIQFLICYLLTDEIENNNGPLRRFTLRVYDTMYSNLRMKKYDDPVIIVDNYMPYGTSVPREKRIPLERPRPPVRDITFDEGFVFSEIKSKTD